MRKRLYLCGASGVGKTRLAAYLSKLTGLTRLPSVQRETLANMGLTFEELLAAPDALADFQTTIFKCQLEVEAAHPNGFVSDRCFDHLVYTAETSTIAWQIYRAQEYKDYLEALRISDDPVVAFWVRPTRACWRAAREQNERLPFLNWDMVQRIDGGIQLVLESNAIPYIPVTTSSWRLRQRLAESVVRLLPK